MIDYNQNVEYQSRPPLNRRSFPVPLLLALILLVLALGFALDAHARRGSDAKLNSNDPLVQRLQIRGKIRLIVGLRSGLKPEKQPKSERDLEDLQARINRKQDDFLARDASYRLSDIKRFNYVHYLVMTVDEDGLLALQNDPKVISLQEDRPEQPHLTESIPQIHADDVWAAGITGNNQLIAILDTGVDKNHQFLANKVVSEACFSNDSPALNEYSLCPNGLDSQTGAGAGVHCDTSLFPSCAHGTHVAGIAAGLAGKSGKDFDGVAKGAGLIAIQVFQRLEDVPGDTPCANTKRPSPCLGSSLSDQIFALERVLELGLSRRLNIAAVNMSLGGTTPYSAHCDGDSRKPIIDKLRAAGIVTITSSGNAGFFDAVGRPACISSVVSVGNVSKYDNVRPSSNSVSFLTFLAPGSGFQAEMQGDGIYSSVPGNGFEKFEGTSMAAPHVAGAFALLRALDPTSSVDDNIALLQQTGVSRTDPKNGQVTPRIDVAAALVEKFRNDAFEDIALLKGGPDGVDDYRMIMVAGPTDTAAGGLALTKHEDEADDYWLDHWSSGRTVGITSISDINGDGAPDIAYLKGGKLGVEDYRTIFVAGPSSASSGEQGLAIEEGAADDYWLDHWSPGRTVGMTSISDINGDGYRDIAYLKGGPGGALDYRLIVVSGPTPDSTGGNNLHKEEGAADDYWLDYWSPGRTVQITAISDISGDGYDDIAYLKGGSNSASDYRLVVVSGPSPAGPGGVVQQIQENAPDDYWLHHWTPGRTVQVTAISDVSGDGYDDLIYLKGGPGGPQDYRLMVVEGPSPTSPGGGNIYKHETVADDYWLDYWAPGRTVRITALRQ